MKIRQFPESLKLSSWRTLEVTLPAHGQRDIGFYDTNPNIFMVNNPNEATLKFGISKMPTTNKYEYKINYSSSDVFGRPTGTGHLYVLNDSSIEVSFTLFSITMDFDPAIMKGTNVLIDLDNLETRAIIAGVNEGVKLPVDTTELEKVLTEFTNHNSPAGDESYLNMVDTFSFTAPEDCTLHFGWLLIDAGEGLVKLGNTNALTVYEGEAFTDMEYKLKSGQVLTITGTGLTMRIKYWTV